MREANTTDADRRAIKVLHNTYWTSAGWRAKAAQFTSPDDFAYAKRAGVMFDPIEVTHDSVVERVIAAVRSVATIDVANSFVFSLVTRRLELRSALGSFAVHQFLSRHEVPPSRERSCDVCGDYAAKPRKEDVNVLNFERFKWGGVRHSEPLYAAFDLELFSNLPRVTPDREAVRVLKELLSAIEKAPA